MSDSKRQFRRSDPRQKPAWRRWLLLAGVVGVLFGRAYLSYFRPRNPLVGATARSSKTAKLLIAGSDAGYVEATACAGCHRQIWETYRRTGMGGAFTRQAAETVVEDYAKNNTYYPRESDRHYTMYR